MSYLNTMDRPSQIQKPDLGKDGAGRQRTQLFDVFVIPEHTHPDPEIRNDPCTLVASKHFYGRMTISALKHCTGAQIQAIDRVLQETNVYRDGWGWKSCTLHGCPNFKNYIVVVWKAQENLDTIWAYLP